MNKKVSQFQGNESLAPRWPQRISTLSKRGFVMAASILFCSHIYAVNESSLPLLLPSHSQVVMQAGQITGKIIDENGEPIIGATIRVKGATQGAISDIDGHFSLSIGKNSATVEVSFVGYQTQTLNVQAGVPITVTLKEDSELLDEVVVVGYGTQKRLTMSSAVATASGEEIKAPVANVSNQLGGRISGIVTRQSSGEPGEDAASVLLRGNTPLVLVDGIERPWEKINQADIESISVLKDAAAVAPYGLKGANGVILINTKRG